jgi:DNA repair protein RecN (Recombination protein N)
VEEKFQSLSDLRQQMEELKETTRSREQRLDFLKFQIDEIQSLNLRSGEDVELEAKIQRSRFSQKLIEFVNSGVESLYSDDDSVMVRLHHLLQRAAELAEVDVNLQKSSESLQQIKTLVEDLVYDLREYGKSLDMDPQELDLAEERLNSLRKLQKKFGPTVNDILSAFEKMLQESQQLTQSDELLRELDGRIKKQKAELTLLTKELHERRLQNATRLAKGVNEELADLNMKGVSFHIHLSWLEECQRHGQTDVEFMIQPSKKEDLKPLAKYASGGELSRILLSLKKVLGASEQPRTYLFDEVDTGVSGETAEKVGRKLKTIAKNQQVICVTHLPQVASFADAHFLIEKSTPKSGSVKMSVKELKPSDRVQEIARLISGERITNSSLDHARQLLEETKSL